MDCVDARLRGAAALTLANALWDLDGRESEAVLPALEAADMFAAEDRNAEAALARLKAADALAFIGRRDAAVSLYRRSFAELDDDDYWDPRDRGRTLTGHSIQYARALLQSGERDRAWRSSTGSRERVAPWEDGEIRFEVAVNTAYTLRDCDLSEQAFEAFLRAARLAEGDADRLQRGCAACARRRG
jgi:tetratricopeptide (TPR) repeat protein